MSSSICGSFVISVFLVYRLWLTARIRCDSSATSTSMTFSSAPRYVLKYLNSEDPRLPSFFRSVVVNARDPVA